MKGGNLLQWFNAWLDQKTGEGSRHLARNTARRSFLGILGTGIVGMSALPLLPVLRAFADEIDELGDPRSCDYWRYCAISGTLCSCCGGSESSCPPGSEPATSLASGGSLGEQVDAFERALIAAELNRPHGSLRSVAEALGLPRKTLHDKLRKHGLSFADAGGSSPDDND